MNGNKKQEADLSAERGEKRGEKVEGIRGTDSAEVIEVIKTTALRGTGTKEDMSRIVTQYWSFEGELLAEYDPCAKEKEQFPTQFSYANFVLNCLYR